MRITSGYAVTAIAAVCALTTCPATAQDLNCPSVPGVRSIDGNLVIAVPCVLNGTRVRGNVTLFTGGSLFAREVRIDGNLEARTAFEVDLIDSRIDGNVDLVELVGDSSTIIDSRVEGKIHLRGNRSFVQLYENDVDSDIEAFDNTGGLDMVDNDVRGGLKCRDNNPSPTGIDNEVRGNEEGQCEDLAAFEAAAPADSGTDPGSSNDAGDGGAGDGDTFGGDTTSGSVNHGASGGGGSIGLLTVLAALWLATGRRRSGRESNATPDKSGV
jgi:hypothetical protein